ncbi:MAG TPA: transcription termination factor Rho [Candidatus Krumholzibacteria bacterium]|nr:transcription termination factor Rho [Candidatus Krumholzibacteria bacterium]
MSETATGVLDLSPRGEGFLRHAARSFAPTGDDVFVAPEIVRQFGLCAGATVTGPAQKGKRGLRLAGVDAVCGLAPGAWRARPAFNDLTAMNPDRRFDLGRDGDPSLRIVDLVAPVGRGTRGLIVAPPKTGKTMLLEAMAKAIAADAPEARIVVLLIDERPEEVTHFRRAVPAEVLASSSDQDVKAHVRLAEMALAQARCELECGHDVVLLVDSLTRMGRAFNAASAGTGRTLSGGVDSRALEIPRRFFGMARNVENGGSITVIATALIETGSRMDDVIFEEFKGTGNMELVLSRQLAERRIFPAFDLRASGTRRDDLMYAEDEMDALNLLRRRAAAALPGPAMEGMLELMRRYPDNAALLAGIRG